ncbi:transcription/translation regulatory transformer protein RfaH [Pantoea cypripedii]|uniref:Transcription antitermination protein RfaH n=1 Tax=Pantoea cypripedii TaxID=55209 RepID=A0A1X1EMF8_PANCY|nr:transcription/translation regulatory transformer protein RfaH [Pantoea cypripedii]MBP2200570.1 transcriptional antiterminator RfaH [Pantoea cypripedii]ORM90066.1 transcriptional activator RfaH [Pantoea cypripedii]
MENWYVAQTKYAQEKRAQQQLQSQGVTCLLPVFSEVRLQNGGIRRIAEQPLFPNYIFVRFDPEVVHTTAIKATRGVSTLISFGGLPSVVPDSVITRLIQGWERAPLTTDAPAHGDRVVIRDGVFEGLEAVWYEPDGIKRAMLLLTLMNRQVPVPVKSHMRFHITAREAAA